MSRSERDPVPAPRLARPGAAGRRFGYAVAVLVNAVLFWLVTVWPGWRVVPFLTEATEEVLGLVIASLIAGVLVNAINFAVDLVWVKALGEFVTSAIAVAVLWRFWTVFPFDFESSSIDWGLATRVVIGVAIAGCMISIVVQFIILARVLTGARPGTTPSQRMPGPGTAPKTGNEEEPEDARDRRL